MKDRSWHKLENFVEYCMRYRVQVVSIFAVLTLVMAIFASRVHIRTVFEDLLPRNHPYVKVHERFQQDFGGSNVVSIMLEVEKGNIFDTKVLNKVKKVTDDLQRVEGVNPFQIVSLASKKLREIRASTDAIESRPVMWPNVPKTPEEMDELKTAVLNNSLIYGVYVSPDLRATLITVDFYEGAVDYSKVYKQVLEIADSVQGDGVSVHVSGEPVLFGWVNHYIPETLHIFLITIAAMTALLFITARTYRGTLLPLLAGLTSAIWALGSARLIGYNLDPLVIVIAFLITARSISHSVQIVSRFFDELDAGAETTRAAASSAMLQLFKPGMLGVIADAGCMIVVVLTPITLMQKVAIIGTIWVLTIALSACIITPVLLSWVDKQKIHAHPLDVTPLLDRILKFCVSITTSKGRYVVLCGALTVFVVTGIYAFRLQVGDADAGSPILWQNSRYNRDVVSINKHFQGADRMYTVFAGNSMNDIKEPAVLETMALMQKYMGAQPEIGGSLSIADIVPSVNSLLREDNPRYNELGKSKAENGELIYMFTSGSEPGDAARFMDPKFQYAPVTFYFRDHRGETIRTAVQRLKNFIAAHPLPNGKFLMAGGLIGVTAAVNEVIFSGQIESVALALFALVICCAVAYRSTRAGIFFMVPVILSNTITFSFMAWKGIGMTVSTLPVAALGIGLGVDYAFYVVDGIREELHHHDDMKMAIEKSLMSAGKGVLITAAVLIVSVGIWYMSSLRFQAEMGMLMGIWLFISSFSALFVMPSMVYVFRPEFVVNAAKKKSAPVNEIAAKGIATTANVQMSTSK